MAAEPQKASKVFLLMSIFLGVLTTVIAFAYLDQKNPAQKAPPAKVLVAKRDIPAYVEFDPDRDLEEVEIPAKFTSMISLCVQPEFKATLKKGKVNRTVLTGTPLLYADLVSTMDLELKGDKRALSIAVKGSNGLSGLLVPGDMVKLYVTRSLPRALPEQAAGGAPGKASAEQMLANIIAQGIAADQSGEWKTDPISTDAFRVLAIGRHLSRSRQQLSGLDEGSGRDDAGQAITLEVTESQAKTILERSGAGQLPVTIILCPKGASGG